MNKEEFMACYDEASREVDDEQEDHLIEKDEDYVEDGTTKSRYRKTGVMMC